MAMNQFIFGGYLTKDPQMLNGDVAKCVLSMAVKSTGKRADYFRIFVWGKLANDCMKCLKKGSDIIVQGHVESGVNNNDGESGRFFTCFAAEKIEFVKHRNYNSGDRPVSEETEAE